MAALAASDTVIRTLYVMERHDQLLDVWRELDARQLAVTHVDFHCDMRGLLVDVEAGRAHAELAGLPPLDEGNYITYALLEGRVARVRWVHDRPGGRLDDVNGVRLLSDLSSRWRARGLRQQPEAGLRFTYQAMTFEDWQDIEPGEFLDIDWDVFASIAYPPESIGRRVERFLRRPFRHAPAHIALCYSPGYAHETRPEFEAFAERLAARFDARTVHLPPPAPPPATGAGRKMGLPRPLYNQLRRRYFDGVRWLRQRGIY